MIELFVILDYVNLMCIFLLEVVNSRLSDSTVAKPFFDIKCSVVIIVIVFLYLRLCVQINCISA